MLVEYHRAISMRGEEEEGGIGIKQARADRVRIPRFLVGVLERLRSKSCFLNFKWESS